MESKTNIKFVRTSPKKLRFIIDSIKKMNPVDALKILRYDNKRSSAVLYKVIHSAIANAKASLNTDENLLKFKILEVSEGPVIKRSRAGGRGNVRMFRRRSSHIQIILTNGTPTSTLEVPVEGQKAENTITISKKNIKKNGTKS